MHRPLNLGGYCLSLAGLFFRSSLLGCSIQPWPIFKSLLDPLASHHVVSDGRVSFSRLSQIAWEPTNLIGSHLKQ